MIRRSQVRLLGVALLLGLPLQAQEEAAPPPAPPVAEPAPAEAVEEEAVPADERVSADNNLSFPVDI